MDKRINQAYRTVRNAYLLSWVIDIVLVIIGECGLFPFEDWLTADAKGLYFLETILILVTILCVPVALRYFSTLRHRLVDTKPDTDSAIQSYVSICMGRLALLFAPATAGIVGYYLGQSSTCILCSCIALIATLFCWPSLIRMARDLHLDAPNDD